MRLCSAVVVLALVCATPLAAAVVVVTPTSLGPWQPGPPLSPCGIFPGSYAFVNGPAIPPLGTGSLEFDIPTVSPFVFLHDTAFNGQLLASVTDLRYRTYVTASSLADVAPLILLSIDTQDPMAPFEQLAFFPADQAMPVTTGVWQQWNATAGVWRALFAFPTPPPFTLASYVAAHPGARLTTQPFGAVAVAAGCDGATQQSNVDALTVAISGASTTYDFELMAPAASDIPTFDAWAVLLLLGALALAGCAKSVSFSG